MVLDQQIPLEWAFKGPKLLSDRLGVTLDAATVAAMDPEVLAKAAQGPPAVHRFPGSMAKRIQQVAQHLVETYDGDAAAVWTGAKTGDELLKRVAALPGFGKQKAEIFVGLLGKQLGVRPKGWRDAAGQFGEDGTYRSVADIRDADSLIQVREFKKEMKARQASTAKGD